MKYQIFYLPSVKVGVNQENFFMAVTSIHCHFIVKKIDCSECCRC